MGKFIKEALPSEYIWIEIRKDLANGKDLRIISIEFKGNKYKELGE